MKELITIKEMTDLLGITEQAMRTKKFKAGSAFPDEAGKQGYRYLYRRADFDAWCNGEEVKKGFDNRAAMLFLRSKPWGNY